MRKVLCAILAVACVACGGAYQQAGSNVATGAINATDTPVEQKKIDDISANASKAATQAAISTALSPDNRKAMTDALSLTLSSSITSAAPALDGLRSHVRLIVKGALDEALTGPALQEAIVYVDTLREHLVGQPFRDASDAWVADLGPKLGTSMGQAFKRAAGQVTPTLDAEAAKWKPIAIGFGAGAGALLLTVIVLTWALHGHRKVIEQLARRP